MVSGKALRSPGTVAPSSHFVMILCGRDNDPGKEDNIGPAKSAEGYLRGSQGCGGHEEDADPNSEKPDQADIVGRLPPDDPYDERDIKNRQKGSRPGADLIKDIHKAQSSGARFFKKVSRKRGAFSVEVTKKSSSIRKYFRMVTAPFQ